MKNSINTKLKSWAEDVDVAISDRYKSPIWTSFTISWLALNWEIPLLIVFQDQAGQIDVIESIKLYKDRHPWMIIWIPLVISFGYSVFGGGLRMLFESAALLVRSKVESWKISLLKDRTIPFEDYQELKHENSRLRRREAEEMAQFVQEKERNKQLSEENSRLKENYEEAGKAILKKQEELNDLEVKCNALKERLSESETFVQTHAHLSTSDIKLVMAPLSEALRLLKSLKSSKLTTEHLNMVYATIKNLDEVEEELRGHDFTAGPPPK